MKYNKRKKLMTSSVVFYLSLSMFTTPIHGATNPLSTNYQSQDDASNSTTETNTDNYSTDSSQYNTNDQQYNNEIASTNNNTSDGKNKDDVQNNTDSKDDPTKIEDNTADNGTTIGGGSGGGSGSEPTSSNTSEDNGTMNGSNTNTTGGSTNSSNGGYYPYSGHSTGNYSSGTTYSGSGGRGPQNQQTNNYGGMNSNQTNHNSSHSQPYYKYSWQSGSGYNGNNTYQNNNQNYNSTYSNKTYRKYSENNTHNAYNNRQPMNRNQNNKQYYYWNKNNQTSKSNGVSNQNNFANNTNTYHYDAQSNIQHNDDNVMNKFQKVAPGSFKYNPYVVNQVKSLDKGKQQVSDNRINQVVSKKSFNDNSYLNALQRGTNYFKFQYFNPIKFDAYYKNLDKQVLALITGEIGSMPDLKSPKENKSQGSYEYEKSDENELITTKKASEAQDNNLKFERALFALIATMFIIFVGIIIAYFVKVTRDRYFNRKKPLK